MIVDRAGARWTLLALWALAGCASVAPPTQVPEVSPGRIAGYLQAGELPDTAALLPPPPAEGTPAFAADQQAYRAASRLKDTPRWALATRDADLDFPAAAGVFSCALDMPISAEATPHLDMLLRRVLVDAIDATDKPKERYGRKRPFMVLGGPTCTPDWEARLKAESYPSGHASIGWAWALALAEIAPGRADAVLQRGYAFGMSRVVCRAHWESDVEAGRVVGAATVSRLHADPVFVAQMAQAKKEIARARASGARSPRDCAAEARALAEGP
jgi:acid phosphatase (class A)